MMYASLPPEAIATAHRRIAPYAQRTPLRESPRLNMWLGHEVVFKVEAMQRCGAFKFRGAMNALLALKEQGNLPREVVAFSSGNHAQAVAEAGRLLGVPTTIFMPSFTSRIKQQATRAYGGKVILTASRQEAESRAEAMAAEGAFLLPPYDHDEVIAGQGTACYEALQDGAHPDAVFATCGGGGLLSGTFLAAKLLAPEVPVFGAEPMQANDAAQSFRAGKIVRFKESPDTIADGARALAVSERTFHYISQLQDIIEVEEENILYWTQWLSHLLKIAVEPTSALAMAAASQWLSGQKEKRRVLVILSGGNISPEAYRAIWARDLLEKIPG